VESNTLTRTGDVALQGQALDVSSLQQGFMVVTTMEVAQVDGNFTVTRRISGSFTAMASAQDQWYLAQSNGDLLVLNHRFDEQWISAAVQADRLLGLQGYLLALSVDSQSIQVIDIRNSHRVEKIGHFANILGNNVTGAFISGGRLWIGGDTGAVFDLNATATSSPVQVYSTDRARGYINNVDVNDGLFVAAADNYGAVTYDQDSNNTWTAAVYPSAYSQRTTRMLTRDRERYILQPDFKRVVRLDGNNNATVYLDGQAFTDIALTDAFLVAASGSRLYLVDRNNININGQIDVGLGENVVAIATLGEVLVVSTATGKVFEITHDGMPIVQADVRIRELFSSPTNINQLTADADYLYYAINNVVHRLRLHDLVDETIAMANDVSTMTVQEGRLLVGVQNNVHFIDTQSWTVLNTQTINAAYYVTGLSVEDDRIIVGQGSQGVVIYQAPISWFSSSAAMQAPVANTVYQQTDTMDLSLFDTAGVNAVRYYVNNEPVAALTQAPFATTLPVPASLPNGQMFNVTARIETVWGEVIDSQIRSAILQGEGLPVNPFTVDVAFDDIYLPKPLQMTATVHNSTQPIEQVEFYYSATQSGPYELIGKHYGPEFVVYNNFDLTQSNHYIKVRAVDVYGNLTNSTPKQFLRLSDPFPPDGQRPGGESLFRVDGQFIDGKLVAGHPFTVNVYVNDAGSGVDVALLRRNGLIIAAAFENGEIVYQEAPPEPGSTYAYEVTMVDNSGNQRSVSRTYQVVDDNPPVIADVQLPAQVREQEAFDITVSASDDLELQSIAVTWHGLTQTQNVGADQTSVNTTINVPDARSIRLTNTVTENIEVVVTDSLGQSTNTVLPLYVIRDGIPDAALLNVDAPLNGFYDSNVPIDVSGINSVDDGGPENVTLSVININSGGEREASRAGNFTSDLWRTAVHTQADNTASSDYVFKLRAMDRLGQTSDTATHSVALTQLPNEIRFDNAGNGDINRRYVGATESLVLQTRVLDSSGRPVPVQNVRWTLRAPNSTNVVSIGTSTTDNEGYAIHMLDTSRPAGTYQIRAQLPTYPFVLPAVLNVEIIPGDIHAMAFDYIPEVEGGGVFDLNVKAV
ncbi:MAG: hypothetical protein PVG89_17850, partial [Gammaproteobacteria bacterium]